MPVLQGLQGRCPVNVDMATYKAEFLSHYYAAPAPPAAGLRARAASTVWARLASRAPGLANAATAAPLLGTLAKRAAGVAPRRAGARASRARPSATGSPRHAGPGRGRPQVLLWPDTFTNYFHPEVGDRRGRGAGGRRLPGADTRAAPVLRPPALRLRHAAHGQALAAAHPGRAPRPGRGWPAGDRPGAQLPGRLPRRAAQPVPRRHRRDPAGRAERHARRVPRPAATTSPRPWTAGAGAGALPPRRGPRLRQREGASRSGWGSR